MILDVRRTAFFDVDGTLLDHKDIPNESVVQQLIERKKAGYAIIVWSAGGPDWAERAVKLLHLEVYVDYILDKPTVCFDDIPPNTWANWWDVDKKTS